jgi:hypothetical protein
VKRIPMACDFCGRVVLAGEQLNCSEVCKDCQEPRRPKTVLRPVSVVVWRRAA